jgi:hypothetical protein
MKIGFITPGDDSYSGRGLTGDFVRYLGAFEHLHWVFSQSGPRAFAHAVEVMGKTTVDQWRAALDRLQLSQPFFSVRIDVDHDKRPYFRPVEGANPNASARRETCGELGNRKGQGSVHSDMG